MKLKQSISLKTVGNARELGGYRTTGGKTIKSGVLLRSAALNGASAEDISELREKYNLRHIVDFRMDMELKGSEDPVIDGVEYHHLDVIDISTFNNDNTDDFDISSMDIIKIIELSIGIGMINENMYIGFLSAEKGRRAFSEFFHVLLSAEADTAVLWHCTNGKDRTGLAAMLLLTALGVDESVILSDYLLTNDYYAARSEGTRALLKARGCDDGFIDKALLVFDKVDEKFLTTSLNFLKKEYGSVEDYIHNALNISNEEINLLKSKYLI